MLPPPPRGARTRARLTYERLRDLYPAVTELAHQDPFQLLIATILSAQTTDRLVNQVTPELFRRYPTAEALAAADPAVVQELIKPTGFYRIKTQRIIAASRKIVESFGGEVPANMDDLVKVPGIGRKTANVILGVGFQVVDGRRQHALTQSAQHRDQLQGAGRAECVAVHALGR